MKYLKRFEGVGDKYAEKRFNIPMEFSDFDKKYNRDKLKDKEDIVFQNEYVTIIKNPKSLDKIGSGVRGVIDYEGNLYVEHESTVTHSILIHYLSAIHIIPDITNWHLVMPTYFITVQRDYNNNLFALGESNNMLLDDDDRFDTSLPPKKDALKVFNKYLKLARMKNPNINFTDIRITDI